jgi:signal transduction histidine kinase
MLLDITILIICSVAISLLGLLIIIRNPKQRNNRLFAYLSIALVLWSVANYLSDHANTHVLFYTRLTYFGGVFAVYSTLNFIINFPEQLRIRKKYILQSYKAISIFLVIASFSPFLVKSVIITSNTVTINTSFLYWLFILYIVCSLILLISVLRLQSKNAKSTAQREQISIVSLGVILYAIFAVLSNVLLPIVINSWSSSRFGPAFTLFFSFMIAYAIIRHKLFDIRLIIARSFAYLLSLATIAGLFTLVAFAITDFIFSSHHLKDTELRSIYTVIAVILALVYPAIKHYFDSITKRIFYRDAYDPESFLDQLNKTIIDNIELGILLRHTSQVIEYNMKCEYAAFVISDDEGKGFRYVGDTGLAVKTDNKKSLYAEMRKLKQRVVIYDQLDDSEAFKKVMRDNKVSIIANLKSTTNSDELAYNFLLIGDKKSGNNYSESDVKIVGIIADELVIAIQNALRFEEIQTFNVTLQERVNEATKKLRRANDKLKALDETKDDFISMASHQLRTPLTSIKGYVSMILEGDAGKVNATQKEMLNQTFFSSQRMVYLIADMLNVSRLRTGKFAIEDSPVDLSNVVEQELDQLKETAAAHSVTLSYKRPKDFPTLLLDETKIRQVIMNFSDNAIYYTPSGGHIEVELVNGPHVIELKVTDDGIGVPRSEKPHLFTKFYRAGNARQARPDGTGLGLYMAKKVIVAQGGTLIFDSVEGKGSTFGFRFSKDRFAVDKPSEKPPEASKSPIKA